MTGDQLYEEATAHAAQGFNDLTDQEKMMRYYAYSAGFRSNQERILSILQQKQAAIVNRHVEFSSDKQVLAVLRELLEELTIQP